MSGLFDFSGEGGAGLGSDAHASVFDKHEHGVDRDWSKSAG